MIEQLNQAKFIGSTPPPCTLAALTLDSVKFEEQAVYVLAGSQVQGSSLCQCRWAHD